MRILLAILLFAAAPAAAADLDLRLNATARIRLEAVSELSGMVRSPRHEDLYWVHNDSGDEARIFAVDGQGKAVIPTFSRFSYHGAEKETGKQPWQGFRVLFAEHADWEDIASDGRYLYLADVGNNLNIRRDLAIYMISEIDPLASTQTAVIRRLPVRYPEQTTWPPLDWHYDSESLFSFEGKLYLITKHRRTGGLGGFKPGANLYRLDTDYTDQDNLLTLVDSNAEMTAATGADLSPGGARLAVVSYGALWLFERPAQGDRWLSAPSTRIALRRRDVHQVEAVAWEDEDTLILGNEEGELFRLELSPD